MKCRHGNAAISSESATAFTVQCSDCGAEWAGPVSLFQKLWAAPTPQWVRPAIRAAYQVCGCCDNPAKQRIHHVEKRQQGANGQQVDVPFCKACWELTRELRDGVQEQSFTVSHLSSNFQAPRLKNFTVLK